MAVTTAGSRATALADGVTFDAGISLDLASCMTTASTQPNQAAQ
jgi:hypothetical protein